MWLLRLPGDCDLPKPGGLIGYWPLDNTGIDVSGNALDGTPIGVEWVAGKHHKAAGFLTEGIYPNPNLLMDYYSAITFCLIFFFIFLTIYLDK